MRNCFTPLLSFVVNNFGG